MYAALALLSLGLPLAIAAGIMAGGGFLLILFVFIAMFVVAAVFVLREKRWAYIVAAVASISLMILFSPEISTSLSNPADSGFWLAISILPILGLVAIFSILAFRSAKTGLAQRAYLASPRSSGGLLTMAVVGFVAGALVAGSIGAGVILRNLAGGSADIEIVTGAASAAIPYSPQTFSVAIGGTVTWINKDSMAHTVTSNTTGEFGSPTLTTGATFSHTFDQAGTYYYHCTPHPQMWGVVIVS